jgi:hypothetical protein
VGGCSQEVRPWREVAALTVLEEHLTRQAERSRGFFWNRLRWELVLEQLPAAQSFELVDVGAGTGFLGDFLRQRRPEARYRFVEPLEGLESDLEERFGAEANLRHRDDFGAAGFVTLLDVLEHQEDDRAFLRELAEKMAPGSVLLITVPALQQLWSEWDVALGHHRRYTRRTLRLALSELPFEQAEVSYLFPELLPAGFLRRLRLRPGAAAGLGTGAEFPDLPRWLNQVHYRVGGATTRARRLWPVGTSLFARLRLG